MDTTNGQPIRSLYFDQYMDASRGTFLVGLRDVRQYKGGRKVYQDAYGQRYVFVDEQEEGR